MYNATQIIYIIASLALSIGILIGSYFIKKQKHKDIFLKFWALATFIIHISIMWVDYLKQGSANAPNNILFPIYFCNACMYLLIIVALMKNKKGKAFYYLATFVAYAGMFGALITLFECHYFAGATPDLSWGSLKSMLSHSTMLIGCLYLFVGKYVKIRVSNFIPFTFGMVGCFALGMFINWLFVFCGLPNPNSMYLVESALSGVPIFNGYTIAGIMFALILIFTLIWEQIFYRKQDRWYNNLKLKKLK